MTHDEASYRRFRNADYAYRGIPGKRHERLSDYPPEVIRLLIARYNEPLKPEYLQAGRLISKHKKHVGHYF